VIRIAGVTLFFAGILVASMGLSLASTGRAQMAWLAACTGSIVAIAGLVVLGRAGRVETGAAGDS